MHIHLLLSVAGILLIAPAVAMACPDEERRAAKPEKAVASMTNALAKTSFYRVRHPGVAKETRAGLQQTIGIATSPLVMPVRGNAAVTPVAAPH